jgi:hypothetical protein
VRYGTEDKLPAAQAILDALGLDWHQAAAMGDDWPDAHAQPQCAGLRAGQCACRMPGACGFCDAFGRWTRGGARGL